MGVRDNMEKLGIVLPPVGPCGGTYVKTKRIGDNLLYVSGNGPERPDRNVHGKLGQEISLEEGKQAAADTVLNILAVLEKELDDLDRITSFVKLLVFVASAPDFYDQPLVANGATELLVQLFGQEIGCPSRSAVGVAVLPGNIPVETECIVAFK